MKWIVATRSLVVEVLSHVNAHQAARNVSLNATSSSRFVIP
jgi:hypothetical protein